MNWEDNYLDIDLSKTDFIKEYDKCLSMQMYDEKELESLCKWVRAQIRNCAGGMRVGNCGGGSMKVFPWNLYPHLMNGIGKILRECPTAAGLITINKKDCSISIGFDEDFLSRNEIKIID